MKCDKWIFFNSHKNDTNQARAVNVGKRYQCRKVAKGLLNHLIIDALEWISKILTVPILT